MTDPDRRSGPLAGVRIVEMASIGPCPFAGMLLADMGATITRIDRIPGPRRPIDEVTSNDTLVDRGRRSVCLDLKQPRGRELALEIIAGADALIEGFRPGVMERLGLGPETCRARNAKLVYGRMTGWGQDGPLAQMAGHDINYIGLSGALHAIGGRDRPPVPPLNLVGDYGGGGAYLAMGVLAALIEVLRGGSGQLVDAAMVDGANSLMTMMYSMSQRAQWSDERESNLIDGAAHFYGTYECSDGLFLAVGAIEPQFYAELRRKLGLVDSKWDAQWVKRAWPALRADLAEIFRTRSRDDWCREFAGLDACVSPVLRLSEVGEHPHIRARATLVRDSEGRTLPAPAPRFERPAASQASAPVLGAQTRDVLQELGLASDAIDSLRSMGIVFAAN